MAFFFHRNGFKNISWEPQGANFNVGEFEIQWGSLTPIFVEVKGPRWEGELSEEEMKGPRRELPRYIHAEARWVDSIGKVIAAGKKAIPKFYHNRPNLLVVVAYLLFVSPSDLSGNIVEPRIKEELAGTAFKHVGGVLIFDFAYNEIQIAYKTAFIENPEAHNRCLIPKEVVIGLSAVNNKFFRRRVPS